MDDYLVVYFYIDVCMYAVAFFLYSSFVKHHSDLDLYEHSNL